MGRLRSVRLLCSKSKIIEERYKQIMKKRNKWITLLLFCICIASAALFTGCGGGEPGTPQEIVLDGVPIVLGESTPGNLGMTVSSSLYDITQLPDRSLTSTLFIQGYKLISVTLVNNEKTETPVEDCVIEEMKFINLDDEENRQYDLVIEGANPLGMTEEELQAAYPELEMDDDESYRFHYLRSGPS